MAQEGKANYFGELVTEAPDISVEEICEVCGLSVEQLGAYVEEGIVEPQGTEQTRWRFSYASLITVKKAKRLESQLGLNTPGVALALDLLGQIEELKRRLAKFENPTD